MPSRAARPLDAAGVNQSAFGPGAMRQRFRPARTMDSKGIAQQQP